MAIDEQIAAAEAAYERAKFDPKMRYQDLIGLEDNIKALESRKSGLRTPAGQMSEIGPRTPVGEGTAPLFPEEPGLNVPVRGITQTPAPKGSGGSSFKLPIQSADVPPPAWWKGSPAQWRDLQATMKAQGPGQSILEGPGSGNAAIAAERFNSFDWSNIIKPKR
jgi:hypothetical protein